MNHLWLALKLTFCGMCLAGALAFALWFTAAVVSSYLASRRPRKAFNYRVGGAL